MDWRDDEASHQQRANKMSFGFSWEQPFHDQFFVHFRYIVHTSMQKGYFLESI